MPISGNIRKFKFDLSFTDKAFFEPTSTYLIDLAKGKFIEVIIEVFESFGSLEDSIIEKIEIDVGEIDINNINQTLANFKDQLSDTLKNKIIPQKNNFKLNEEEAILFFLEKGFFPWWISGNNAFNDYIIKHSKISRFSRNLILVITENKDRYFRIINALNNQSKNVFYRKILLTNFDFFKTSTTFFNEILSKTILKKPLETSVLKKEIEFYLIRNIVALESEHSKIFLETLRKISAYHSIPFNDFIDYTSKETISSKTASSVQELFLKLKKKSEKMLEFEKSIDDNYGNDKIKMINSGSESLAVIIKFIENGIEENDINSFNDYKNILGSLINDKSIQLIQFIKNETFFKNKLKVERLILLIPDNKYRKLIGLLKTDEIKHLIQKVYQLFSEKEFLSRLSIYKTEEFINYKFKKTLLNELFQNQKENAKTFINNFIKNLATETKINKSDLIFELYKFGKLNKFKIVTEKIIRNIFNEKDHSIVENKLISSEKIDTPPFNDLDIINTLYNALKKESFFVSIFKNKKNYLSFVNKELRVQNENSEEQKLIALITAIEKKYGSKSYLFLMSVLKNMLNEKVFQNQLLINLLMTRLLEQLKTTNQKKVLIEVIYFLIQELPLSKKILLQEITRPSFYKKLTVENLILLFNKIKSFQYIDFNKIVERILKLIDQEKQIKFELALYTTTLELIIYHGLKKSKDFYLEKIINKYPLILISKTKNKLFQNISEDSLLTSIINRFNDRVQTLLDQSKTNSEIEKFNSLIQFKKDILENKLNLKNEKISFNFKGDFIEIISTTENLIEFLNLNYDDHELITVFSEITLDKEFEVPIIENIKYKNDAIFIFEAHLLKIQKKYNLIALDLNSFKVILRTYLLRKIGASNSILQFSIEKFIIDFFENLRNKNYINYQQLLVFLSIKTLDSLELKIIKALTIFNTKSNSLNTNLKVRNEIFYKNPEDSLLTGIINRFNDRVQTLLAQSNTNSEIEKFNSLIQLKKDILENKLNFKNENISVNYKGDFIEIISTTENLIEFLNLNYDDHELLTVFSEITLDKEFEVPIIENIKYENDVIFIFEAHLLKIQKKYNLVALDHNSYKVILRTYLLRKIGASNSILQFSIEKFIIDFFENLRNKNYVNYQQILVFLSIKTLDSLELKIIKALTIFNTKSNFSITSLKVKNEMFYKDLVFYYLVKSEIPSWSNITIFDNTDVLLFLENSIKKQDIFFLKKIILNSRSLEALVSIVLRMDTHLKFKLLDLILIEDSVINLSILINKLELILKGVKLSTSISNQNFLIKLILEKGFWKITNLIVFIEKFYRFIAEKTSISKVEILELLSAQFNISKSLYLMEKNPQLSKEDYIEILKYYLEIKKVPENLKKTSTQIKEQLTQLLLKEEFILMDLLNENMPNPNALNNILSLISIEYVLEVIYKNIFDKNTISQLVGVSFKDSLSSFKTTSLKQGKILSIALTLFKNRVSKNTIALFFKEYKKIDDTQFENFFLIFKNNIKKKEKSLQDEYKSINEVLSSENSIIIEPNIVATNLSIVEYYLEIGSVNYENETLTKKKLYILFIESIKKDSLFTKKMVYEWIKFPLKLKRLLDLMRFGKRKILLDLIHPELYKNINLFSSSLDEILSDSLEKAFSLKNDQELDLLLIRYWSRKNIFIESSFDIIVPLFEDFLINQKKSDFEFFKHYFDTETEFTLKIDNFIKNLKRNFLTKKNKITKDLKVEKETSDDSIGPKDSVIVKNAGLVILWPFLFRLFDKCGLLMDKKFKDDISLQKGIIMTQYLVTGSIEINEDELVLNKILCGVPTKSVVDITIKLEEIELDICNSLLKGVLQNWKKLNSSSVETLRKTFLIREGILVPNELDYDLSVVKETFDMLIDTIPWNISMIQTVFMKNRINVDWK